MPCLSIHHDWFEAGPTFGFGPSPLQQIQSFYRPSESTEGLPFVFLPLNHSKASDRKNQELKKCPSPPPPHPPLVFFAPRLRFFFTRDTAPRDLFEATCSWSPCRSCSGRRSCACGPWSSAPRRAAVRLFWSSASGTSPLSYGVFQSRPPSSALVPFFGGGVSWNPKQPSI